jgi:NTE family protein
MKKGLVISGGGSKGSFAGGILEYLINEKKYDWDVLVGTSTGSMLVPLISVGEIEKLKSQYTNITNKDIFSVDPFNKKGKIRILNLIWRLIRGKNSIGEVKNLEKLLREYYTETDFNTSIQKNKDVFVTTTNVTDSISEYIHQKNNDYEMFCDYIVASASIPIVFPIKRLNETDYLDGGIIDPIPIQKAIDEGCDEIDIIILSAEQQPKRPVMENMVNVAINTIRLMNIEITRDDISIGNLEGDLQNVKLNIYRTPVSLTKNSAIFDKEEMRKWWAEGYEFAKNNTFEQFELVRTKTKAKYKVKKVK